MSLAYGNPATASSTSADATMAISHDGECQLHVAPVPFPTETLQSIPVWVIPLASAVLTQAGYWGIIVPANLAQDMPPSLHWKLDCTSSVIVTGAGSGGDGERRAVSLTDGNSLVPPPYGMSCIYDSSSEPGCSLARMVTGVRTLAYGEATLVCGLVSCSYHHGVGERATVCLQSEGVVARNVEVGSLYGIDDSGPESCVEYAVHMNNPFLTGQH